LCLVGVLTFSISNAQATTVALGTSGWTATWPTGLNVALTVTGQTANSVTITKTVTFNNLSSIPIVFQQTSTTATDFIVVDQENVTNSSGSDWSGFRFIILGSSTGTLADPQFDTVQTNVNAAGGFSIDPFTTSGYFDNSGITLITPRMLEVGGGAVANGGTWTPGAKSGALWIHAGPSAAGTAAFTFKEEPLDGQIIPLPTSAAAGLSGLAGLALIGVVRRLRRSMA
jgi:hypothetical protein